MAVPQHYTSRPELTPGYTMAGRRVKRTSTPAGVPESFLRSQPEFLQGNWGELIWTMSVTSFTRVQSVLHYRMHCSLGKDVTPLHWLSSIREGGVTRAFGKFNDAIRPVFFCSLCSRTGTESVAGPYTLCSIRLLSLTLALYLWHVSRFRDIHIWSYRDCKGPFRR